MLTGTVVSPDVVAALLRNPSLAPGGVSVAPSLLSAALATPQIATGVSLLPSALVSSLFAPTITVSGVSVSPAHLAAALFAPTPINNLQIVQVSVTLGTQLYAATIFVDTDAPGTWFGFVIKAPAPRRTAILSAPRRTAKL